MAKSAKSKAKPQKTNASPAVAAPPPEDDFVAPEDLIGSDLAAQLQDVLDEARLQLDGMEAIAPRSAAHDEIADAPHTGTESDAPEDKAPEEDDAVFESPEEVFATAEPDGLVVNDAAESEPAHASEGGAATDNMDEFESQLKELLAMGTGESAAPATSSFEHSSAAELPASSFEDAVDQQAQIVGSELDDMTKFIDEALAAPQDSTSTEEPAIAAAGATMTQLDEFLAGHADHAVSDEFETVQDLLGAGGIDAAQSPAPAHAEQLSEIQTPSTDGDDEFASPEQLFGGGNAPLEAVGAVAAPADVLSAKATAKVASLAMPAASPVSENIAHDTAGHATETRAARLRRVGLTLGRIVVATTQQTYRVCSVLNRPLQNASASTRRNIGMIGLITLANASLLILGKLLNLWG